MDAENRAVVRRIVPNTGMVEGSKDDPEAGAGNTGNPQGLALDPQQRRGLPTMVDESTAPRKTLVRKRDGRWRWVCPCGYHGTTTHHRLAVLFAAEHAHQRAEVAA